MLSTQNTDHNFNDERPVIRALGNDGECSYILMLLNTNSTYNNVSSWLKFGIQRKRVTFHHVGIEPGVR